MRLTTSRSIIEIDKELTVFIIKELRKNRSHKEIIRKVCERGGFPWKEAERLTILIEAQYKRTLAAPQTPWLLFFSIGILLLGIGLLAINLQVLLELVQKDVLVQISSLQSGSYRVTGFITGLGMTVGGMVGLWKAFSVIFPE